MHKRKLAVLIGGELTRSREAHLNKLLELVRDEFTSITIIHEGAIPIAINHRNVIVKETGIAAAKPDISIALRILRHVRQETKRIRIISKDVDRETLLLFKGIYQPFSILFARILHMVTLLFAGGFDFSPINETRSGRSSAYSSLRWVIQLMILKSFNRIIFETPAVLRFYGVERFREKSLCNGHLFVDTEVFRRTKPLTSREYDIGFIGALTQEKGIIPFIQAVCMLLQKKKKRVIIVGQGHFQKYVKKIIADSKLGSLVEMRNGVEYSKMPDLYNSIKLLVVPSESEGLPNVVIEAMSCGTSVLAASVGGIPDVIKHGKTGYLLNSIRVYELSMQIDELLNNPETLENTSTNARLVTAILDYDDQEHFQQYRKFCWTELVQTCVHAC